MHHISFVASIAASLLLAAGGCAIVDNELSEGTPGYVSFGFEVSAFYPCDSHEQWWVESDVLELQERYDAIVSRAYERVYARLRGSYSRPGQYGHLGSYHRVYTVSEVLELRKPVESDCRWQGPHYQ